MNIMVFNVPAETVGALSILNDFYNEIKQKPDKNINWIFVLSRPKLEETENIRVLNFPWIKKSWFHRLYFDNVIAPKLIKKFNVEKVLSFQNIIIPHTKVEQVLYMHNSLPFVDYKFTFKENKHLWIYQNLIGRNIVKSIKKANRVIVQSEWIKNACIEKAKIYRDKINVISPRVNIIIDNYFEPQKEVFNTFFYPASEFEYKNHKVIVDACKRLKKEGIKDYKVIFTLKGNENNHIDKLYNDVKGNELSIEFVGSISREKVFKLYTKSILVFPSYIETYGLPMHEARLHKGMILASDCPFSHEILNGYENAYFFDPFNENELFELMNLVIKGKIVYNEKCNLEYLNVEHNTILKMIMR
ncbi:glycosyltransferase [Clostridium sp. UBA5988]|uniref:glycosyltransferase n=1 Tax=Clostridium sp. UBA5988 TaxID=1946369 RepID=UPI0032170C48